MEKLTNKDLIELWNVFNCFKEKVPVKFSYFLSRNKNMIKHDIKIMQAECIIPDAFFDYEEKRVAIAKKYSTKDDNGNPVIEDNVVKFDDKGRFDYEVELKKLNEEYKDTLEEKEKIDKIFEEISNNLISDYQFYKLKLENYPELIDQKFMDIFVKFDLIMEA